MEYDSDTSDDPIRLSDLSSSMSRKAIDRTNQPNDNDLLDAFSRATGSTMDLEESVRGEMRRNNNARDSVGALASGTPRRQAPGRPASTGRSPRRTSETTSDGLASTRNRLSRLLTRERSMRQTTGSQSPGRVGHGRSILSSSATANRRQGQGQRSPSSTTNRNPSPAANARSMRGNTNANTHANASRAAGEFAPHTSSAAGGSGTISAAVEQLYLEEGKLNLILSEISASSANARSISGSGCVNSNSIYQEVVRKTLQSTYNLLRPEYAWVVMTPVDDVAVTVPASIARTAGLGAQQREEEDDENVQYFSVWSHLGGSDSPSLRSSGAAGPSSSDISAYSTKSFTVVYSERSYSLHKLLNPVLGIGYQAYSAPDSDIRVTTCRMSEDELTAAGMLPGSSPSSITGGGSGNNQEMLCFLFSVPVHTSSSVPMTESGRSSCASAQRCIFVYCYPANAFATNNALREHTVQLVRSVNQMLLRVFRSVFDTVLTSYHETTSLFSSNVMNSIVSIGTHSGNPMTIVTCPLLVYISSLQSSLQRSAYVNKSSEQQAFDFDLPIAELFGADRSYVLVNNAVHGLVTRPNQDWYSRTSSGPLSVARSSGEQLHLLNDRHHSSSPKPSSGKQQWYGGYAKAMFQCVYTTSTSTGISPSDGGAASLDGIAGDAAAAHSAAHAWYHHMVYSGEPVLVPSVSALKIYLATVAPSASIAARGLGGHAVQSSGLAHFIRRPKGGDDDEEESSRVLGAMSSTRRTRGGVVGFSVESLRCIYELIQTVDKEASSVVLVPINPTPSMKPNSTVPVRAAEVSVLMLVDRIVIPPSNTDQSCFLAPTLPTYTAIGSNLNNALTAEHVKELKSTFTAHDVGLMVDRSVGAPSTGGAVGAAESFSSLFSAAVSYQHTYNLLLHQSRLEKRMVSVAQLISQRQQERAVARSFSHWISVWGARRAQVAAQRSDCVHMYTVDLVNMLNESILRAYAKDPASASGSDALSASTAVQPSISLALSKLEYYCSLVFPPEFYDVHVTVASANPAATANTIEAIASSQIVGDSLIVNNTQDTTSAVTSLVGLVYAHTGDVTSASDRSANDTSSVRVKVRQDSASHVDMQALLAVVRVSSKERSTKGKMHMHPFSVSDVLLVKQLCELTSSMYRCFHANQSNITVEKTGVRAVAFQAVKVLLPLFFEKCIQLLGANASSGDADEDILSSIPADISTPKNKLQLALCTIAHWVKLIYQADVVLIRLHSSAMFSQTSSPYLAQLNGPNAQSKAARKDVSHVGELLFSSEDHGQYNSVSSVSDSAASGANGGVGSVGLQQVMTELDNAVNSFAQLQTQPPRRGGVKNQAPVVVQLFDPVTNTTGDGTYASLGEIQLFRSDATPAMSEEIGLFQAKDSGRGDFQERHEAVQLIGYSLARVLSLRKCQKQLVSMYHESLGDTATAREELGVTVQQLAVESRASVIWRNKLSASLAMSMFISKLPDVTAMPMLASIIESNLPNVLGCKSIVFLVQATLSSDTGSTRVFKVVSSTPDGVSTLNLNMKGEVQFRNDVGATGSPSQQFLNVAQINQIPNYADILSTMTGASGLTAQAKILLCASGAPSKDAYGMLLLFPEAPVAPTAASNSIAEELLNRFGSGAETAPTLAVSPKAESFDQLGAVWQGLEGIVADCLGSAILNCISKFEITSSVENFKQTVLQFDDIIEENKKMHVEYSKLAESREQLQATHQTSLSEVEALKAQLLQERASHKEELAAQRAEYEGMLGNQEMLQEEQRVKFNKLVAEAETIQHDLQGMLQLNDALQNMVQAHTVDKRCYGLHTAVEWLQETLTRQYQHHKVVYIKQNADGTLSGGQGIRGVIPAAAEALRTGNAVEIEVVVGSSSTSSTLHLDSSTSVGTASGSGSMYTAMFGASQTQGTGNVGPSGSAVRVLCVPHPNLTPKVDCDTACFVFLKKNMPASTTVSTSTGGTDDGPATNSRGTDDGEFTFAEKQLIQCMVALTSSSLIHSRGKYSMRDMELLEQNNNKLVHFVSKIRESVDAIEHMWKTGIKTRDDLESILRDCMVRILARPGSGTEGLGMMDEETMLYKVAVSFYYPGAEIAITNSGVMREQFGQDLRGLSGLPPDLSEHFHAVLKLGQVVRRGAVMWVPMKSQAGDVASVIQIERKVSGSGINAQSRDNGGTGGSDMEGVAQAMAMNKTLTDLFLTQEEEDVIRLLCRMTMPMVDNAAVIFDAYSSIQHAGEAISAIQEAKGQVEDKLVLEVAQRLEMEETLRSGMDILSDSLTHRMDLLQLLDATRKAIITATSSDECFIMTPKNYLMPSSGPGAITAEQPDGFDEYSLSAQNEHSAFSVKPTANVNANGSNGILLYTLETDQREPAVVRLESGDMETLALINCRTMSAAAAHAAETSEEKDKENNAPLTNAKPDVVVPWNSWAVRKLQGSMRVGYGEPRDEDKKRGAGTATDGAEGGADYHILVIPFALVGNTQGVITLLRRAAPYSIVDRECAKWFSRVLVYSLYMKEAVSVTLVATDNITAQSQAALVAYGEIKRKSSAMEVELKQLHADLCDNCIGVFDKIERVVPAGIAEEGEELPVVAPGEYRYDVSCGADGYDGEDDGLLVQAYIELLFSGSAGKEEVPDYSMQKDHGVLPGNASCINIYLENDAIYDSVVEEFRALGMSVTDSDSGRQTRNNIPYALGNHKHRLNGASVTKVRSKCGEIVFAAIVPQPASAYHPTTRIANPSVHSSMNAVPSVIYAIVQHRHFSTAYVKITYEHTPSPSTSLRGLLRLRFSIILKIIECVLLERMKVYSLSAQVQLLKADRKQTVDRLVQEKMALVNSHSSSEQLRIARSSGIIATMSGEQRNVEELLHAVFRFCSTEPICNNRSGLLSLINRTVNHQLLMLQNHNTNRSLSQADHNAQLLINLSASTMHASARESKQTEESSEDPDAPVEVPALDSTVIIMKWVKTIADMFSKVISTHRGGSGAAHTVSVNTLPAATGAVLKSVDAKKDLYRSKQRVDVALEQQARSRYLSATRQESQLDDILDCNNDISEFVFGPSTATARVTADSGRSTGAADKERDAVSTGTSQQVYARELIRSILQANKAILIISAADELRMSESEATERMTNERVYSTLASATTTPSPVATASVMKDVMQYIKHMSVALDTHTDAVSDNGDEDGTGELGRTASPGEREGPLSDTENDDENSQSTAGDPLFEEITSDVYESIACIACNDYPHGSLLIPLLLDTRAPSEASANCNKDELNFVDGEVVGQKMFVLAIVPTRTRPPAHAVTAAVSEKAPLMGKLSVTPTSAAAAEEEPVAFLLTTSEVFCWCIVAKHLQCVMQTTQSTIQQIVHYKENCRRALGAVQASLSARERRQNLMHAFTLLKMNVHVVDLQQMLAACPAPEQMHFLETTLGDWSDLVRGMNSSVIHGVSNGVTNLWATACGTLMSLLSSHVSIKGCGLLLSNQEGEVIELFVKDLSTPMLDRHGQRNMSMSMDESFAEDGETQLDEDFAKGIIDVRPPIELGASVQNLAWEILNSAPSDTTAGHPNSKRIFKLVKPNQDQFVTGDGKIQDNANANANEEQLWLVPVRTVKTVLGVIRVTIEVAHNSSANSRGAQIAGALSTEARVEAALGCLNSFADVFAPLVVASRHIDSYKARIVDLTVDMRKSNMKQQLSNTELSNTMKKMALLTSVINICHDVQASEPVFSSEQHRQRVTDTPMSTSMFGDGPAAMDRSTATVQFDLNDVTHNQSELGGSEGLEAEQSDEAAEAVIVRKLQALADTLAPRLRNLINGCTGASIEVTDNGAKLDQTRQVQPNTLVDYVVDENNNVLAVITLSFESTLKDLYGQTNQNQSRAGPLQSSVRVLDFETGTADVYAQDIAMVTSVLPAITRVVSTLLNGYKQDIGHKLKITTAVKSMKALENMCEQQHSSGVELEHSESSAQAASKYYFTLGNVLNICLNYLTVASHRLTLPISPKEQLHRGVGNGSGGFFHTPNHPMNWIKTQDVANCLTSVSQQLYSLIMSQYNENLCAVVRFGLVIKPPEGNGGKSSSEGGAESSKATADSIGPLYWHCYYPPSVVVKTTDTGGIAEIRKPQAAERYGENSTLFGLLESQENVDIIATNLAQVCLRKGTVSYVEVGGVLGSAETMSSTAAGATTSTGLDGNNSIRIINYPLSYSMDVKKPPSLGVLQIIVDAGCELGKHHNQQQAYANTTQSVLAASMAFVPSLPPAPLLAPPPFSTTQRAEAETAASASAANFGTTFEEYSANMDRALPPAAEPLTSQSDVFYADVSQAVANTLYGFQQRYAVIVKDADSETQLSRLSTLHQQMETAKDAYRKRGSLWYLVSALGAELYEDCQRKMTAMTLKTVATGEDLLDVGCTAAITEESGATVAVPVAAGGKTEDGTAAESQIRPYSLCDIMESLLLHNHKVIQLLTDETHKSGHSNVHIALRYDNANPSQPSLIIPVVGVKKTKHGGKGTAGTTQADAGGNGSTFATMSVPVAEETVFAPYGGVGAYQLRSFSVDISIVGSASTQETNPTNLMLAKIGKEIAEALAQIMAQLVVYINERIYLAQQYSTLSNLSVNKLNALKTELKGSSTALETLQLDVKQSGLQVALLGEQNKVLNKHLNRLFVNRCIPILNIISSYIEKTYQYYYILGTDSAVSNTTISLNNKQHYEQLLRLLSSVVAGNSNNGAETSSLTNSSMFLNVLLKLLVSHMHKALASVLLGKHNLSATAASGEGKATSNLMPFHVSIITQQFNSNSSTTTSGASVAQTPSLTSNLFDLYHEHPVNISSEMRKGANSDILTGSSGAGSSLSQQPSASYTAAPSISALLQCLRFKHIVETCNSSHGKGDIDLIGIPTAVLNDISHFSTSTCRSDQVVVLCFPMDLPPLLHQSASSQKKGQAQPPQLTACIVRLVLSGNYAPAPREGGLKAQRERRGPGHGHNSGTGFDSATESEEELEAFAGGASNTVIIDTVSSSLNTTMQSPLVSSSQSIVQLLQLISSIGSHMMIQLMGFNQPPSYYAETLANSEPGATASFPPSSSGIDALEKTVSKYKKIYSIVCREAINHFLDPPPVPEGLLAKGSEHSPHHALLAPAMALQDVCLKALAMVRSLVRSDGQAIIIKESAGSDDSSEDGATDATFRLIYTGGGNCVHWKDVPQGSLGTVVNRTASRTSIVEHSMRNHKSTVTMANSTRQPEGVNYGGGEVTRPQNYYNPAVDGIMEYDSTPMLLTNLRGRDGVVIGSLITVRRPHHSTNSGSENDAFGAMNEFTKEDIAVVELIAVNLSLSLYWCEGLGTLHSKLTNTNRKIGQLEEAVEKLNVLA